MGVIYNNYIKQEGLGDRIHFRDLAAITQQDDASQQGHSLIPGQLLQPSPSVTIKCETELHMPHTASKIQLMDAGIIQTVKLRYKKQHILLMDESTSNASDTAKQVCSFTHWHCVMILNNNT